MSLRTKTIAITLATTLGLVALSVPLRMMMLDRFETIERELAERDLDRARNTLTDQAEALRAMARDYSAWDETYAFVAGEGEGYITRNFADTTFAQNRIGLVAIVATDGHEVYTKAFDLAAGKPGTPPTRAELFPTADDVMFAHHHPSKQVGGFLQTSRGVMIVGSHPILTSTLTGPPRGSVVMGRLLDAPEVARLASTLRLALTIELPGPTTATPSLAQLRTQRSLLVPVDDDTLLAYARLDDVRGAPTGVLRIAIPRTVYAQGRTAANTLALAVVGASLLFGLLLIVLLQRFVVRRVTHLAGEIAAVAAVADHSLRVTSARGGDELADLATNTNTMLDALEKLTRLLDLERAKAEKLLRNILPPSIAERLNNNETIADSFASVSVLFADIVGFTDLSSHASPTELVVMLNEIFSRFDALAERHGLEKIKTIGDAYMIVSGLPVTRPDHAEALATMALDMQEALEEFNGVHGTDLQIRIGINTGPVVAGVIGTKKFIYDLWGDAVNIASRMESSGVAGRTQITEATHALLVGKLDMEERGMIAVKGKGDMRTWLLARRAAP